MQMTKAAALAILAFTSSAVAYFPDSGYSSGLYAREAYPEAYPEAEFDFEDIYARDAEPEFDIHPRDAYEAGYEAGLYARALEGQKQQQGGRAGQQHQQGGARGGQQGGQFNLNQFQKDSQEAVKFKQDIGSDQKAFDKERKEMMAAEKKLQGAQRENKQNNQELSQDRKEFGALRNQANENKRPGQHQQNTGRPGAQGGQHQQQQGGRQQQPQRGGLTARDLYDYYGFDY